MGHRSPSHQWDMRGHSLFLLTPMWARGTSISLRVLHKHLLLRRWATWAKAWVGVEAKISRSVLQGPKGVSMLWYCRLSLQISLICGVHFGFTRVLFKFGCIIFTLIDASCVKNLGLEVETLEKPLYVNSPLGTRVSVDKIYRDCVLEILGILLTVDLRVIDISDYDVILGMDWLTAHRGLLPTHETVVV